MNYKVLFIVTVLASTVLASSNGCGPYCVGCDDGKCQWCQGYELVDDKCDLTKPLTGNCDIYGYAYFPFFEPYIGCLTCKEGYATDFYTGNCEEGVIQNCFIEYANVLSGGNSCIACNLGSPTDFPLAEANSCDNPNPYPNCLKAAYEGCFECKPGYVVSDNTGLCVLS